MVEQCEMLYNYGQRLGRRHMSRIACFCVQEVKENQETHLNTKHTHKHTHSPKD